jgi:hypothetical protein
MVKEVLQSMPARLAAVGREVADANQSLALALRQRAEVVREADRDGMSQRAIGKAVGIAVSRVSAILGTPDDDDKAEAQQW